MDLQLILDRFAESIPEIDSQVEQGGYNRRTGELYLPGVKTMTEKELVSSFKDWWLSTHPEDFQLADAETLKTEVNYRRTKRAKLDLLLSNPQNGRSEPYWAIEVKHIALVGNNGKNNDFNVAKMLSPYLKDRSLMHDISRLANDPFCLNQAVIGYCFDYSFASIAEGLAALPHESETFANIRDVCSKVDPLHGRYSVQDLVDFADDIFAQRGLVQKALVVPFGPTWKHPAGGYGRVFGWQLNSEIKETRP